MDKKKLRNVTNNAINGVKQISLSHVIIELIVDEGTSVTKAGWIGPFQTVGGRFAGCVPGRELASCYGASVTLYLWFRF